jgi:hypothetical protein
LGGTSAGAFDQQNLGRGSATANAGRPPKVRSVGIHPETGIGRRLIHRKAPILAQGSIAPWKTRSLSMIDHFSSLPAAGAVVVDIMPGAPNTDAAGGLMIVGLIIILLTALGAVGGLAAAVGVRLKERRERRIHFPGYGAKAPRSGRW